MHWSGNNSHTCTPSETYNMFKQRMRQQNNKGMYFRVRFCMPGLLFPCRLAKLPLQHLGFVSKEQILFQWYNIFVLSSFCHQKSVGEAAAWISLHDGG